MLKVLLIPFLLINLAGCSKTIDPLYSYFSPVKSHSKTYTKKLNPNKVQNIATKKDINWYKLSAKSGNINSQYVLGNTYFKAKKYSIAKSYYTQAAKNKHSKSQFKLALMYYLGEGTTASLPSRKSSTKDWLGKAILNGNIEAKKAWDQLKIDNYWCLGGICY